MEKFMKRITIGYVKVALVVCPWLIREFIGHDRQRV
jgi:hypothetical protein